MLAPSIGTGPRGTSKLMSTAPCRRSSPDELLLILSGFPPKRLIPGTLKDDHDPRPIERGSAQLEKEFGDFLPVPARDQRPASTDVLREDRERDAERRLPEDIHLIDVGAFADQVADDISQPLVGG